MWNLLKMSMLASIEGLSAPVIRQINDNFRAVCSRQSELFTGEEGDIYFIYSILKHSYLSLDFVG